MIKDEKILMFLGIATWLVVVSLEMTFIPEFQYYSLIFSLIFLCSFIVAFLNAFCTWALVLQLISALLLFATLTNPVSAPIFLVMLVSQLPERLKPYHWLLGIFSLNLLLVAISYFRDAEENVFISIFLWIFFQLFVAASCQMKANAKKTKSLLEKTHLELVTTQSLLQHKTQIQERLRISRDLHDNVGHKLTVINLHLEYALHQSPENTQTFFRELKQSIQDTLEELRLSVRNIRSTHATTNLSELFSHIETALPKGVCLIYPKSIKIHPEDVCEQLLFCVQEAISNAIRHGKASEIRISVEQNHPFILNINNNGLITHKFIHGSGLYGLTERLEPYHANIKLQANNPHPGMNLNITLPHVHGQS